MGLFAAFTSRAKCRLCSSRMRRDAGLVLVHGRQDHDMSSVMFAPEERVAIDLLARLGLRIQHLQDIQTDVALCNSCFAGRFKAEATTFLNDLSLLEHLRKGGRLGGDFNLNMEQIGGIGLLGVREALSLLVDMYDVATQRGIEPVGIPYWIVTLCVTFSGPKTGGVGSLLPAVHTALSESLRVTVKTQQFQGSSWPTFITQVDTLVASGVSVPDDIIQTIAEYDAAARAFLGKGLWRGQEIEGWLPYRYFGGTPEIAEVRARETVAGAERLLRRK